MQNIIQSDGGRGPVIAGTGFIPLDIILPSGQLITAIPRIGGTCGNVMAILSALGWRSYPVARFKRDDPTCALIAQDCQLWGVKQEFLHLEPSVRAPIILQRNQHNPAGGFRHSFSSWCPCCQRPLPGYATISEDQARSVIDRLPLCQVFFFDRASPGNLILARSAVSSGALVVFEPSGIGTGAAEKHFREAITLAHVLKYSRARLQDFADNEKNLPRTALLEIATLGEAGLRYRTAGLIGGRSEWRLLPAFSINVTGDTCGNGDWCTAVFAHLAGSGG